VIRKDCGVVIGVAERIWQNDSVKTLNGYWKYNYYYIFLLYTILFYYIKTFYYFFFWQLTQFAHIKHCNTLNYIIIIIISYQESTKANIMPRWNKNAVSRLSLLLILLLLLLLVYLLFLLYTLLFYYISTFHYYCYCCFLPLVLHCHSR